MLLVILQCAQRRPRKPRMSWVRWIMRKRFTIWIHEGNAVLAKEKCNTLGAELRSELQDTFRGGREAKMFPSKDLEY